MTITFENATEKRIDVTRTERHFCKCNTCKESTTVDFEIVCWSFPWFNDHIGKTVWEPRIEYYRLDGENKVPVKNTYIAQCPRCEAAKPFNARLKKSKVSAKHVCDDRCQTAISESCTCSCGGHNHGIKNKINL